MGRARVKDVDFKDLEALVKFCQTDELEEKDATVGLFAAANRLRPIFLRCSRDHDVTVYDLLSYDFPSSYLFG